MSDATSAPGPRRSRIAAGVVVLGLTAVLAAAPLALAKQTYTLTDQGWRKQAAVDPGSPAGRLQAAQRELAEGHADAAQDLAEAWIQQHPSHPLMPEALLLKADARVAQHNFYDALFDYEKLIRAYPAAQQYMTALEREYEIARLFVNGMKRKFWGMRIFPADGEGEELLIRIQERAPGSDIGEKASLLLGDYYYNNGEMGMAATAYDLFLQNYPESQQREWAMLRVIQANLARYQGPAFDQTGLLEARQRLEEYQKEFPSAAERIGTRKLLVRINESLAQRDLTSADWYAQRGEGVSVVFLLRRLVHDYPDTTAGEEAVQRLRARGVAVVVPPPTPSDTAKAIADQRAGEPAPEQSSPPLAQPAAGSPPPTPRQEEPAR